MVQTTISGATCGLLAWDQIPAVLFPPVSSPKPHAVNGPTPSMKKECQWVLSAVLFENPWLCSFIIQPFAVQSCIIVSQGSTHHLLLMMCKCKLNFTLPVTTSNASKAKHEFTGETTAAAVGYSLCDAHDITPTMSHQRAAAEHQSSQQTRSAHRSTTLWLD